MNWNWLNLFLYKLEHLTIRNNWNSLRWDRVKSAADRLPWEQHLANLNWYIEDQRGFNVFLTLRYKRQHERRRYWMTIWRRNEIFFAYNTLEEMYAVQLRAIFAHRSYTNILRNKDGVQQHKNYGDSFTRRPLLPVESELPNHIELLFFLSSFCC